MLVIKFGLLYRMYIYSIYIYFIEWYFVILILKQYIYYNVKFA